MRTIESDNVGRLRPRLLGGPGRAAGPAEVPRPDDDVTDGGERIAPGDDNFCFYAHLSIYLFAAPYVIGRRVLDAGSGTGYGSSYLLEAGARSVLGVDASAKAVDYSRRRYTSPGLRYEVMDLQRARFAPWQRFDLIYCSNVMEHLADPDASLARLARALTPGGVFILAVPPIQSRHFLEVNLQNPYHLTNITPRQWLAKVRRHFHHARGFRHWVEPEHIGPDRQPIQDRPIREGNFTFTEKSDDEMMLQATITTVVVARGPRSRPLPAAADEHTPPPEWGIDAPSRP